ncbi:MAG: hypothetical protein R3A12_02695 [Ignavibacteria bacterium]
MDRGYIFLDGSDSTSDESFRNSSPIKMILGGRYQLSNSTAEIIWGFFERNEYSGI